MDDAARAGLVAIVVDDTKRGISESVLKRAFEYWRNIDEKTGKRIEEGVKAG